MNLPKWVDDPSLLDHEPLRSHITMYELANGQSRLLAKKTISLFVEEMQKDGQVRTRNVSLGLGMKTGQPFFRRQRQPRCGHT